MNNQNSKQSNNDDSILKDFQTESTELVEQMMTILESCEGDFKQVESLEKYGQIVDRIMGGAQSVAIDFADTNHLIHKIGSYAALCKAVSYKASQIKDNPEFYNISVAFLLDATEILEDMIENVEDENHEHLKEIFSKTFLDRLQWISNQFGKDVRATVKTPTQKENKMNQNEIDELMKKLGL